MSETLQLFIIASLSIVVSLVGVLLVMLIRRERENALEKRGSKEGYEMVFTPERNHLDNSVRELHLRYAQAQEQIDELGKLLRLSLNASEAVPEPRSSFSRSLELARNSSFLRGLGLNFQDEKVKQNSVFVLTPFVDAETPAFEAVRRSCGNLGLSAFKASESFAGDNILNSIIYSIVYSRFVVANITGRNANVFYEAAIAQMLEKRVIFISEATHPIPFDVAQQTIVTYTSSRELETRLTETIARYGIADSGL